MFVGSVYHYKTHPVTSRQSKANHREVFPIILALFAHFFYFLDVYHLLATKKCMN